MNTRFLAALKTFEIIDRNRNINQSDKTKIILILRFKKKK